MRYISTAFGVDSSSRFPLTTQTDTDIDKQTHKVRDVATDHPNVIRLGPPNSFGMAPPHALAYHVVLYVRSVALMVSLWGDASQSAVCIGETVCRVEFAVNSTVKP